MKRTWWIVTAAVVVICVLEGAALGYVWMRRNWQIEASATPIERGRAVAERAGCFGCHGPGGTSPIHNPGSESGDVPDWSGGTWMMWNSSELDVRAWIVDGHPEGREPDADALIPMPAYAEFLTSLETDDLVAYVLAVSQFGRPPNSQVAAGRDVALRFGCFGCHGPEGRGTVANPGSFKGYIPGWDGDDYLELVRGEEEFRQWVVHGVSDRLRDNPAASIFVDRQATPMPAFGDLIDEQDLDTLLAYVEWVRSHPRSRSD